MMEGSDETECCKTSPSQDQDESDEGNNESCKVIDGGSSSNSTVEESDDKKPSVRPYVRSKTPRLRWTPDLHLRFENAVERLGGQDRATPKLVLQLMNIKGLNIAHVKSHLQMYRSKKIDEPNQGMLNHRLFMEGVDRNIYNLSQLPILPSFNQWHHQYYNLSYGDVSWNGHEKWMHGNSTTVGRHNTVNKTIPGLYGTLSERILSSSHYFRSENFDLCDRISSMIEGSTRQTNKDSKDAFGTSLVKQESGFLGHSRQNPIELHSSKLIQKKVFDPQKVINYSDIVGSNPPSSNRATNLQKETGFKRKASDYELDLNLSLVLESRKDEQQGIFKEDGDQNYLSLSLYSTLPSSKIIKKLKEADFRSADQNPIIRGVSTLDLTL